MHYALQLLPIQNRMEIPKQAVLMPKETVNVYIVQMLK